MKRTTEQRQRARERKARSRRLAAEGKTRVEIVVDVDIEEKLRAVGALKGEGGRSEIADAVAFLLRSRLGLVTRDTRRRGGR